MASLRRCWVIVDGSQPTAFHSRDADQLIPTLKQLQRTQPHVALMWFERGKLWVSPEAARQALRDRRTRPETRSRDWRPGGEHRDPKARPDVPRDVKRARFKERLIQKSRSRTAGPGQKPEPRSSPGRADYPRSKSPGPDRQRQGDGRQRPEWDGKGKSSFGHKTNSRGRQTDRETKPGASDRGRRGASSGGPRSTKRRSPK